MSLLKHRVAYRPFAYPKAFDYFQLQEQAQWVPTEVNISSDVKDYNEVLSDVERHVITMVLRLFTQTERGIEDFWTTRIYRWFPVHEIRQMCAAFGNMEAIHSWGYDFVFQGLGLAEEEYLAFAKDPAMQGRITRLETQISASDTPSVEDLARSLAIFSAFTEGVSLFSSFSILMNFSRFNRLKGIANIVRWSARDEDLHSEAGCWLFKTLMSEHPDLWTDDLKRSIYQAARDTVDLEDAYLDRIFEMGEPEGITKHALKQYVRVRANSKLREIGLKPNWRNVDKEAAESISSWFDVMIAGKEQVDFFSQRSTEYARGTKDWRSIRIGVGS
jgi:ribonucleoside-diphosphate reductase beta chain